MRNKVKPVLSLFTMGLFLLFGLASFGPDGSTNTTVAIKNCEDKTPLSGTVTVVVQYVNLNGQPIANATGVVFVVVQNVKSDGTCTFEARSEFHNLFTDANGRFSVSSLNYTFTNSQDLIRVEVSIDKNAEYIGNRQVRSHLYGVGGHFDFQLTGLRKDEL